MTLIEAPPQHEAAVESPPELLFPEARRRRRRRRLTVSVVSLVFVAAIGLGLLLGNHGGQPPATEPSLASAAARFTPPTTSHGERTTMFIRLPDGRGYSLSYISSLGLSHFELTVNGQVAWPVRSGPVSCCDKSVVPVYGPVSRLFIGRPIAVYQGADGRAVPYYGGDQATLPFTAPGQDYLAFSFGSWSVLVSDPARTAYYEARMTPRERMTWASAFDAYIAKGGFLIMAPRPPLRVVRGRVNVILHGPVGVVEFGAPCSGTQSSSQPQRSAGGLAWCDPKSLIRISVTGQPRFVALTSRSLAIQTLVPIR